MKNIPPIQQIKSISIKFIGKDLKNPDEVYTYFLDDEGHMLYKLASDIRPMVSLLYRSFKKILEDAEMEIVEIVSFEFIPKETE